MKTIVLACGSGIATSTAVAKKVADMLDENGYQGQYDIVQCAIAEAKATCAKRHASLLIATTVEPEGLPCLFVSGVPFLTSVGRSACEQRVLEIMAQ